MKEKNSSKNNNSKVLKKELKTPALFKKEKEKYIRSLIETIEEKEKIIFDIDELSELLLSACRANDFGVIEFKNRKRYLNRENILRWLREKLIPNSVVVNLDDEDVIRLLLFSIQITDKMFTGGTMATITQKGFRERRRTFEAILVDQFVGKLGEVITKKFLENNFNVKIELDWNISPDIKEHKKDILNAKKKVSIKTSPTLAGIWAEADKGYNYGIMVKCATPLFPILQFFIEVCGFSQLLNFVESKIPPSDNLFQNFLKEIKEKIKYYKCGEIKTKLKGFICGYFKTSRYRPVKEGRVLEYLGKVRESRYLVCINELKYTKEDWKKFLEEINLTNKNL